MKKILTLLFAVGVVAAAQAQSSRSYPDDRSRDVILGDRNERVYDNNNSRYTYYMSVDERDRAIDRINRDYDRRLRKIERDRWSRSSEKAYQVRQLEDRRREEIRELWERFRSSNNLHADNRSQRSNRRW